MKISERSDFSISKIEILEISEMCVQLLIRKLNVTQYLKPTKIVLRQKLKVSHMI